MTSKEALKRLYYDAIDSIIDKEIDCKYLEEIEKDYMCVNKYLTKLEEINNVWHKNETMESVDINGNHLQELYDFIHKLCEENEKLKKAFDILKGKICLHNGYVCYDAYADIKLTKEECELLKGVLEDV